MYNSTRLVTKYGITIRFIPDYVLQALESKGVTLFELDDDFNSVSTETNYEYDEGKIRALAEKYEKLLSKNDLKDIYAANELGYKNGLTPGAMPYIISPNIINGVDDKYIREFIRDNSDFNMSSNKTNPLWETRVISNTAYVILHRGFFDFLITHSLDFKAYFVSTLLSSLLQLSGIERVHHSDFFRLAITTLSKNL